MNHKSMIAKTLTGAAAVVALTVGGAVEAATTSISAPGSEASHADIFSKSYGGSFSADGLNFTNGSVTAVRVDDNNDQIIPPGVYNAEVKGVFAHYGQSLGVLSGTEGKNFTRVLKAKGKGHNAQGSATELDLTSGEFRWARKGWDGTRSSAASDNVGGRDHLVTYQIVGLDTDAVVTMLFFEDLAANRRGADFDFNDLVVEVRGKTEVSRIASAPTPTAFGAGLFALGALAMRRKRRHEANV